MEVTNEAKQIIKEEKETFFTLETRGMKLTFSINNLKQVLEAMNGLIVNKYLEYAPDNINKVPIEDLLPWSENLPKELSIR